MGLPRKEDTIQIRQLLKCAETSSGYPPCENNRSSTDDLLSLHKKICIYLYVKNTH